ncbi:thiamine pyrophosphate-dependent enzyme [Promethearchaeum syntrophicum]|uniref:Thiamine pyrophosphate-dependent enzyme n=1 Tax=Promethearchaeum syntrophicum TaxID=2594042 RepID=A0A5B9DBI5_9ARCH|nr:thiamine pyrophosphate-dependent enzyme [Candidatus Prometheoarchaeum syntrophicum]QEE16538.1 Indolepyruvate oxidoreductase subunit IorA [Candidatus Prometheoarchaeum syntrophicum]
MFHPKSFQDLFTENSQKSLILTGNEAYARGLYEAGAQFLATYPGTPTSEIGDIWEKYARTNKLINFDLSLNETVAFEAAVGASWSGVRAAVSFKHLGMNLIADALHSVMYSGIDGKRKAGLVIICGGDPEISSSTNAEDIRLFSFHSKLPILEPSSIQECKDFVKLAFKLSETWDLPVLIYSPSRLNHASGLVNFQNPDQELKPKSKRFFQKDFDKYLNAIHWAGIHQKALNSKIKLIQEEGLSDQNLKDYFSIKGNKKNKLHKQNQVLNSSDKKQTKNTSVNVGIITSGISWAYVEEFCSDLKVDIPRLRIKLSYPVKTTQILDFIEEFHLEFLIIVEEQESFLELQIKNILFDNGILIPILGKQIFPEDGALSLDIIIQALGSMIKINNESFHFKEFKQFLNKIQEDIVKLQQNLPVREPTFCPGCSHRNVFYALRKAVDKYQKESGREPIFGGDIGCYTLSMSKPYSTMDWLICMGAGVGIANGVARVINSEKQHLIAMIGDSTFFHTGIQPIYNLAKDNSDVLVLILDNYFCSMTGHQISPSTPSELLQLGNKQSRNYRNFSIFEILQTMGDFPIEIMDGYSISQMNSQFQDLFTKSGLKFALVNAECALNKSRRLKRSKKSEEKQFSQFVVQIEDTCTKCNECFERLGCTAIQEYEDIYQIDSSRCIGEHCLSCIEICPVKAIVKKKREDQNE